MGNDEPVYLLSLDGGGIRGISELVILHEIMKRLQEVADLKELPKPRDYFHLIGGTSTGGLIAIMLGRMGMTTEEAINCYDDTAKRIFRRSNRRLNLTFREKALETGIQETVAKRKLRTTVMLNDDSSEKGLTFVCSARKDDMGHPYLFRTYRGRNNHAHNVEIWEAARATTAAPMFFDPISIKIEAERAFYVDGAVVANNPAKLVLKEAEAQFGSGRKLGFLLSLGTGLKATDAGADVGGDVEKATQRAVQNPKLPRKQSGALTSRGTILVFKRMKMVLTDTEVIHHELDERFQGTPDAYFRLNLDKGASDIKLHKYKMMNKLKEATMVYLRDIEVSPMIDKIARILHLKKGVEMPLDATNRAVSKEAATHAMAEEAKTRAVASAQFTGRLEILDKMDRHFCERPRGSSPRRLFRIWGMGGVGKTQIVLKFRDLYGSRFDRVFWINAASEETIYDSFRVVNGQIFGGEPSKPNITGILNWLAREKQDEWLLIFDNNDSIDVKRYIPGGKTGNILFTSRRYDITPQLDNSETFAVDVMNETDAVALLLRASKKEKQDLDANEEDNMKRIVRELGYLPLAIDQAGSYVNFQECSFLDYIFDFESRRKQMLQNSSLYPGAFEDNPAVYGTFELSYEALERRSKENGPRGRAALNALRILNIFCFYHNENLTDQLISRAAVYTQLDTEFIRGEEGSIAPLPLLDRTEGGNWDPTNFKDGIRTLKRCSLIKQSVLNESYSMHILVHAWARDRMSEETLIFQRRAAREILFFTINRATRLQDELHASQVLPHLVECLAKGGDEHVEWMRRTEQMGKLARTYTELGRWQEAICYWESIVADREQNCDPEDWTTIAGLWDLAKALRDAGKLEKSEEIFEDIRPRLRKCPRTNGLLSRAYDIHIDLAKVYLAQARYQEAADILSHICEKEKARGWDSGPYRRAITTLAAVIRLQGVTWKALEIENFILHHCIRDERIGPGHRMTMSAISNTALLHSQLGMHDKADEMWRQVLDVDQDLRGTEHPITLQSRRNVAMGCANLEKFEEAEEILRDVLRISQRVLGSDHLDTLTTMDMLACVLAGVGKSEEATSLWETCLDGRTIWLGEDHPDTEITRRALARLREGAMMLVQEEFQSDGFLHYGDSNFVSHAERDRYLH